MPSLSEVLAAARECEVEVNGLTIHLVYDPNVYTPEAEAEWTQAEAKGQSPGHLTADFLSKLLVKWDLLEDAPPHRMIPLTFERLQKIPFPLLTEILEGITQDLGPKEGIAPNREQRRAQQKKKK